MEKQQQDERGRFALQLMRSGRWTTTERLNNNNNSNNENIVRGEKKKKC